MNPQKTALRTRKLVLVTPEMAKGWLARNHNNRSVSQRWVDEYVRAMRTGGWSPERGVPIQITPEGNLGNGQHRLSAVVAFGEPVLMVVEHDVPLAESILSDVARPKSLSDLRRQLCSVTNATREVAIGRAVAHIAADDFTLRLSDRELEEVLGENEDGIQLGVAGQRFRSLVWGAIAFAYPIQPEKVRRFADELVTGADLRSGSPVLALRNTLIARGAARCEARSRSSHERIVAAKCLSAIYHYLRGNTLARVLESDVAVTWCRRQRQALGLDAWVGQLLVAA